MTKRTLKEGMALLCLGLFLVSAAPFGSAETLHRVWAIKDCRLVSPGGPIVAKATILIRDGLIEAVGAERDRPGRRGSDRWQQADGPPRAY